MPAPCWEGPHLRDLQTESAQGCRRRYPPEEPARVGVPSDLGTRLRQAESDVVEVGDPAERLWSPHTRPFREPQSLSCHPEARAISSLCSPGGVGSSKLQIVPCPAGRVGKSSLLATQSGAGRELPRTTYAGDRPGSLHTPNGGCLLPGPLRPCSPNPGLRVPPSMWPQHT